MTCHKSNRKTVTVGKLLSICLMVFCLLFLTSMNYFVYPAGSDVIENVASGMDSEESDTDYPPAGPTEEKSCNSAVTVAEEILHEAHPVFNFEASNFLYLHHIAEAEKIEMFHPERVLPPPKF